MSSKRRLCMSHSTVPRASIEVLMGRAPAPHRLVAAILILVIRMVAHPLVAEDLPPAQCHRITFQGPMVWPTSGAWSEDGQALLAVDAYQAEILRISLQDGEVSGWSDVVGTLNTPELQPEDPKQIRLADDGWLLLDKRKTAQIIEVSSSLQPTDSMLIQRRRFSNGTRQGGETVLNWVYDFVQMDSGILAFGDTTRPDGGYESAFLYFNKNGDYQAFARVENQAPARFLYVRNMRYLAALDTSGYILTLDNAARLGEVRVGMPGVRELSPLPEEFRDVPSLKGLSVQGPRKATEIYERLENSSMAAGLYSWGRRLYLLGKEAISEGGTTKWWLVRMDPQDGAEISRVPLPTKAAHLTIVPGGDFWGLIEREPVAGVGSHHAPFMETPSMLLLPTTWLDNLNISPLSKNSDVECPVRF